MLLTVFSVEKHMSSIRTLGRDRFLPSTTIAHCPYLRRFAYSSKPLSTSQPARRKQNKGEDFYSWLLFVIIICWTVNANKVTLQNAFVTPCQAQCDIIPIPSSLYSDLEGDGQVAKKMYFSPFFYQVLSGGAINRSVMFCGSLCEHFIPTMGHGRLGTVSLFWKLINEGFHDTASVQGVLVSLYHL